jgi:hypothetical protein
MDSGGGGFIGGVAKCFQMFPNVSNDGEAI